MVHGIIPVIDNTVRQLCYAPYPNHPKGCPNYNNRDICPPKAFLFEEYFDMKKEFIAVSVLFNLAEHVEKLRIKHPNWNIRQLECCLYWQGKVRKELKENVCHMLKIYGSKLRPKLAATYCPEAMGVNVTETMARVGINLEWPPKNIVRKIAIIGSEI